jgi:hypothetical protein
VAAWVPDMFCNFYLVKNHKIAINATAAKGREKISTIWNPQKLTKNFDICLGNL